MDIARRLRTARLARGYNQRFLAEKAGLSGAYVHRVESSLDGGDAPIEQPSLDSIEKLARALDAPLPWLAFGHDPDPDWVTAFLTGRPPSQPPDSGNDGSEAGQ